MKGMSLNIVFGFRVVIETILAGHTIEKIFLQNKNKTGRFKELYALICKYRISYSYVPVEKLNKLARGNHQGVLAILSPIAYASLEGIVHTTFEKGLSPLIIVLDGITDVHNLGAIARTALCMGADAMLIPMQGSASISGGAMKTSAGALARLPVCRVDNLSRALKYLKESGVQLVACYERADQEIYNVNFKDPVALIFGGEQKGISKKHLQIVSTHVKIPMQSAIASLNVSVAAGMVIYEVFRQRNGF